MIFLDIESDHPVAGAEPDPFEDRAVSICLIETSNRWLESDFAEPAKRSRLINPGFPLNRTEIHGIKTEDLLGAPKFKAIAHDLLNILDRHEVIVHYNGNRYDVPLLWCEFDRAGFEWNRTKHQFVDLSELWRKCEPRTLSDCVKRFLGTEHGGAHTAEADTSVLVRLLPQIVSLAQHTGLVEPGASLEQVADVCRRTVKIGGKELEVADLGGNLAWTDDGRLVYTAKRVRGVELQDDPGFGNWMLRQTWIGPDTRRILEQWMATGEYPTRRTQHA